MDKKEKKKYQDSFSSLVMSNRKRKDALYVLFKSSLKNLVN